MRARKSRKRRPKHFKVFVVVTGILMIAASASLIKNARPLESKEVAVCGELVTRQKYYKSQNGEPHFRQSIRELIAYQSNLSCQGTGKVIFELYR